MRRLIELLTLRPLFEETSRSKLIEQVLHREPTPSRKVNARIPRDLEVIGLKCLNKEPSCRYGSLEELAAELRRFLAGETIRARPVGVLERGWRWCRRLTPATRSSGRNRSGDIDRVNFAQSSPTFHRASLALPTMFRTVSLRRCTQRRGAPSP